MSRFFSSLIGVLCFIFGVFSTFLYLHYQFILDHKKVITSTSVSMQNFESIDFKKFQQELHAYESAMHLEEIIGLLAILVTISVLFISLVNFYTFKNEKETLNEKLNLWSKEKEEWNKKSNLEREFWESKFEKFKDDYAEEFNIEKETIAEELKDKINEISIKRSEITLQIYTTKSEYINHYSDIQEMKDVLPDAQAFELKLLKLLTDDHKTVLNSFSWFTSMLNPIDIKNSEEYIDNLRRTVELIQKSGYFSSARNQMAYREFLKFIN